jgi:ribosomal protein S18 acetylase RimI-like enzyme
MATEERCVIVVVAPAHPAFGDVCVLFDAYRVHYGQACAPAETRRWLRGNADTGQLRITAALDRGRAVGLLTSTVIPASLTLGTAWLIRDLYVAPGHRRTGTARALLDEAIGAARASGARRVSLQTETGNTAALNLYRKVGFEHVDGIEILNLGLA